MKGPPQLPNPKALNHVTLYQHSPFYSEELISQANPSCRHCYGTGSPGTLKTMNMKKGFSKVDQPLLCSCVVRCVINNGEAPWVIARAK